MVHLDHVAGGIKGGDLIEGAEDMFGHARDDIRDDDGGEEGLTGCVEVLLKGLKEGLNVGEAAGTSKTADGGGTLTLLG